MYVYILNDGCSFYGEIIGVYSSKEKAEKALKKFNKKVKSHGNFNYAPYIQKREIDKDGLIING